MEIILSPEERSNLELVAARRSISPEALLALALAKRPPPARGVKSNGWSPRRAEFLDAAPVAPRPEPWRRKSTLKESSFNSNSVK